MSNILSGQHLVAAVTPFNIMFRITRNETGYIIDTDGFLSVMLGWISHRLNFTYSYLQVNDTELEESGNLPGFISYVTEGVCDVIVGPVVPTPSRINRLAFVYPFSIGSISYIMPVQNSEGGLSALFHPFQLSVWICLLFSVLFVFIFALFFNWYLRSNLRLTVIPPDRRDDTSNITLKNEFLYIVGVMLDQVRPGDASGNKSFMIHLLAGTWCIATFFLTNLYSLDLTAYVTAPNPQPLLESIYDLPNHPGIQTVMNDGVGFFVDPSAENTVLIKQVMDNFRAGYPKSSCNTTQQCIDMVKSDFKHIYISAVDWCWQVIQMDFEATRKCNLQMGNGGFMTFQSSWGLPKNSPFLEQLSKGTMLFFETPMVREGDHDAAKKCQDNPDIPVSRLTLQNLAPAFSLLFIGYSCSLAILIREKILFHSQRVKVAVLSLNII